MPNHDIIAIGTSAGGLEALTMLLAQLPGDLQAALFVVQHIAPEAPSLLAPLLDRAGPLTALQPRDGEEIRNGHVYVAQPDRHLLIKDGHVRLTQGPRENRSRPAIDPLFRSAAVAYGPRVVSVVLTGLLNDGTSGLLAVKRCGGIAVVQDPKDAAYPDMPLSALTYVQVDYTLPVSGMGTVLSRLAQEQAGEPVPVPEEILRELEIAENGASNVTVEDKMGTLAPYTCPECGGSLWALHNDKVPRYRCNIGHALTLEDLLAEKSQAIENTLWEAFRTMDERARLLTDMARKEREGGRPRSAKTYEKRATESWEHAKVLKNLLMSAPKPAPKGAPSPPAPSQGAT